MDTTNIENANVETQTQVDNTNTEILNETAGADAGGATNGNDGGTGTGTPDVEIPESWEQPIKDFLNGITDPAGRRAMFDKFKNFDDGYQKKFKALSDDKKAFEKERSDFADERQLLGQYKAFDAKLRDDGVANAIFEKFGNIPNYMAHLHAWNMESSKDPAGFIIRFCQAAGIDSAEKLDELLNSAQAQQTRTATDAATMRAELTREFDEKLEMEREKAKLEAMVSAFAADTAAHPYFDQVRNDMAMLAKAYPQSTLDELYELAVYKNPELRAQIAKTQTAAATAAADVAKARKAVGVPSSTPANVTKNEDWRSYVENAFGH